MNQKLPIVIAALASLVVVGIWWRMGAAPDPVTVVGEVAGGGVAEAPPETVTARPRRNPEEMRARRDAWMEAHAQKRTRQAAGAAQVPALAAPGSNTGSADGATMRRAMQGGEPPMGDAAAPAGADDDDDSVEGLRETALSDTDPDERINALWALAVTDEEAALPVLSTALRDQDREVRLAAVQELGGLDDERGAVDALSIALGDPDSEIRSEAMRLIGDSDDPRAAHLAGQLLNDSDPDVRDEAQAILDSLDDDD